MKNELTFDEFINKEFGHDVEFWKRYATFVEESRDNEVRNYIIDLDNTKHELLVYKKAYHALAQAYCMKGECGFCELYDVCRKSPNFSDAKPSTFFSIVENYFLKEPGDEM